jgi:hypothetical protein
MLTLADDARRPTPAITTVGRELAACVLWPLKFDLVERDPAKHLV